MRILYVAFTRPKDKLILLGSVRELDKAAKKWAKSVSPYSLSRGKSFLDWICPPLMRHPDGGALRDLLNGGEFDEPLAEDPSEWKITLHDRSEITILAREDAQSKDKLLYRLEHPDEYLKSLERKSDQKSAELAELNDLKEFKKIIEERFSWDYPYRYAVNIPSKLTVTEIKKMQGLRALKLLDSGDTAIKSIPDPMPSLIDHPRFLESSRTFTAAERGTIVHFVLQHLDLSRVDDADGIRRQVAEMVQRELLTEEEAETVDIGLLDSFFRSGTGLRIRNASGVRREVPFNFRKKASEVMEDIGSNGDTLLIQGVIDCFFEEDGQWILIDYKTDYVDTEDGVKKLADRYKVQIDLYTEALEKITGKPVRERILYLLSINRAISL